MGSLKEKAAYQGGLLAAANHRHDYFDLMHVTAKPGATANCSLRMAMASLACTQHHAFLTPAAMGRQVRGQQKGLHWLQLDPLITHLLPEPT